MPVLQRVMLRVARISHAGEPAIYILLIFTEVIVKIIQGVRFLENPVDKAHRAVIFAIARLS